MTPWHAEICRCCVRLGGASLGATCQTQHATPSKHQSSKCIHTTVDVNVMLQAFFKRYEYKHETLVLAADEAKKAVFAFDMDSVS